MVSLQKEGKHEGEWRVRDRGRDRDSLVAVASLAAAFLHESSDELAAVTAASKGTAGAVTAAGVATVSPLSLPEQLLQHPDWQASPPDDLLRPLLPPLPLPSSPLPRPPSLLPPELVSQLKVPCAVCAACAVCAVRR